jgi:hypothetical protein
MMKQSAMRELADQPTESSSQLTTLSLLLLKFSYLQTNHGGQLVLAVLVRAKT